jgi:uncharacterized protein YraI
MKLKIAGFTLLLTLIGAWAYVHAQTTTKYSLPSGSSGRYQVVAVDFDETTMSGVMKHKSAIRIDTQTGQTWELTELQGKEGGRNLYWEELNEYK